MAFDTKKWLTEDLGFSAEDADALLPRFADRTDKLESGYLRQSDYSRRMNDLKKAQDNLAAENDRLNRDMAEWATLTESEKAQAGDLRTKLEESQSRIFSLEQKLTRVAEENGIDPKTLLPGGEPTPKPKEPVAAFDPEPLHRQMGALADFNLTLSAELPAIAEEHYQLTGERFNTREFVAELKANLKAGKTDALDPVKVWESKYGIAEKRTQKATEKYQSEIAAAEERGRVAARSEALLPNHRPVGDTTSPALRLGAGQSKLQRPQPMDRLAGARAALASGKYAKSGDHRPA